MLKKFFDVLLWLCIILLAVLGISGIYTDAFIVEFRAWTDWVVIVGFIAMLCAPWIVAVHKEEHERQERLKAEEERRAAERAAEKEGLTN